MNAQIYSLLLTFCPADLRREFGTEMTQVFLEDLEEQRRRSGLHGVVRVWRRSFTDLCGAVVREAIARRQFVAPLIAYALLQLYAGFVCVLRWETPSPELIRSFSLYGLICAMVAFVVARVADYDAPELLELESR